MTQEEAEKIAQAVQNLERWGRQHVEYLCEQLNEKALGFTWTVEQSYLYYSVLVKPAEPQQ